MKTKKWTGRLALLTVLLILVSTVLIGCGGKQTPTLNVNEDSFKSEVEIDGKKVTVTDTELQNVAFMLAAAFSQTSETFADFTVQEALVAAMRGYDMLADDYDPNGDFSKDLGINLEAAKKVITEANKAASKSDKVLSDKELETALNELNAEDVKTLVDSFKTSVTTESGSGLWDKFLIGIGTVLKWMTRYLGFGSYVLGICIFAILVELLMIPLAIRQQKNSIKQAALRPKEMAIRNKYKGRNDQPTLQKMQNEIQELYQRENFSPYSGCLPLLVQLPIIMILYNIVMDPLHYVLGQSTAISSALQKYVTAAKAAGGLGLELKSRNGTIELLSRISSADLNGLQDFKFFELGDGVLESLQKSFENLPNFNIGPFNFGLTPTAGGFGSWETWFLLLVPVLTFTTYFFTSKLNRKFMYQPAVNTGADSRQMACSNQMMDITMPAMSAFFTLAVPSVIGVYWMFRSWLGFAKTVIMAKVMPLPTFTEEDIKAATKEMAGKKTVQKSERAGAVRSLHYIDDEDFEDTRARGIARREAIEAREKLEEEQKKNSAKSPLSPLPLKKDKKKTDGKKKEGEKNETLINEQEPSENMDNDNKKDEV